MFLLFRRQLCFFSASSLHQLNPENTPFLHLQLYDVPTATKTRGINGRSATNVVVVMTGGDDDDQTARWTPMFIRTRRINDGRIGSRDVPLRVVHRSCFCFQIGGTAPMRRLRVMKMERVIFLCLSILVARGQALSLGKCVTHLSTPRLCSHLSFEYFGGCTLHIQVNISAKNYLMEHYIYRRHYIVSVTLPGERPPK